MTTTAKTFMGNPCKRGHDGLRYESTGGCVHCALLAALAQKRKPAKVEEPMPVGQST